MKSNLKYIVPIINIVLYTSKSVKRVDLIFLPENNKAKQKRKQRDTRKLWEIWDISITLVVMMISQVFAYVQTH